MLILKQSDVDHVHDVGWLFFNTKKYVPRSYKNAIYHPPSPTHPGSNQLISQLWETHMRNSAFLLNFLCRHRISRIRTIGELSGSLRDPLL